MRTLAFTTLLVGAVVGGTTAYFFRAPEGSSPRSSEDPAVVRSVSSPQAKATFADTNRSDGLDANGAAAVLTAADQIPTDRAHDRQEVRELVASVCVTSNANQSSGNEWLHARIDEFCKSYSDAEFENSSPDDLAKLQSQGTRSYMDALLSAEGDSREAQAQAAADVVLLTDSPWEAREAVVAANERGLLFPQFTELKFHSDLEKRDAMNVLAEMQFCRLSSGCGPQGIVALRACMYLGGCERPTGVLEVMRQHTSLRAYQLAEEMSLRLDRERRSVSTFN